ncbi:hypothetical protein [Microbacterium sp. NPDC058345]|uniref:hypothetical protein n=1 Tax=Microbacterium sp. NPDC058345 TaxID=3346455 RepID=UPI003650BCC4
MTGLSRIASVAAAAALAATAALVVASPASASSPALPSARQISCPDKSPSTFGEYSYVQKRGTMVDEYFAKNGTAMTVWSVDGHYEVFGTNGVAIGRICFDRQPPELDDVKPAETQVVHSGGGGGSSIGHVVHGSNIGLFAVTKWVKWTVRVN